jgi:hypothetical protein
LVTGCAQHRTTPPSGSVQSPASRQGHRAIEIGVTSNAVPPVQRASPRRDVLLLFELDEGIGGQEITTIYQDDRRAYDRALENVYDALRPLTQAYRVAVLIYPQHHYRAQGYGRQPGEPLDRVSSNLLHALAFFQAKGGISVYLEMYSSGIRTNQNGELAALPPAPLHAADSSGVDGLPMDVDTLAALRQAYPAVLEGIRFHELVGTDQVHVTGDAWWVSHSFAVRDDVIRALVDTCATNGLRLVWSDHTWPWNVPDYKPDAGAWWEALFGYATAKLEERVTYSRANNNFSLPLAFGPADDRVRTLGRTWGMSVQSWFWNTQQSGNLNTSWGGPKFFRFGEDRMPVELMASFTLKGLREGASVIQYEPAWYFFNCDYPVYLVEEAKREPSSVGKASYTGSYEQAPDYSGRLALRRLIRVLLDPASPDNPAPTPAAYYGTDAAQWESNLETDPPKKYFQTTLTVLHADGYRRHFDLYNNGRLWQEQNQDRFAERIFAGKILTAVRMRLTGEANDDLLIVKEDGGRRIAEFDNQNSGLMATLTDLVADNADGRLVGVTTANLVSATVATLDGDPDEIVVARAKETSANLHFTVYQLGPGGRRPFDVTVAPLPPELTQERFGSLLGAVPAADFVAFAGLRFDNSVFGDMTRRLGGLAVLTAKAGSLHLETRAADQPPAALDLGPVADPRAVLFSAGCINFDYADELCVLRATAAGAWTLSTVTAIAGTYSRIEDVPFESAEHTPATLFTLSKYAYNNAATNLRQRATANAGKNLALGCPVTMNAPDKWGNVAAKASDGRHDTWASDGIEGHAPTLTVDLGVEQALNRVVIGAPNRGNVGAFSVRVSVDGTNWAEVATEPGAVSNIPLTYDFAKTQARYVRLEVTRTHRPTGWVSVSEIEAYCTGSQPRP